MTTKVNEEIDRALLELVKDGLVTGASADKITLRILGESTPPKPAPLSPDEIRALRERENVSQAVLARHLNVTVGYVSKIERGAKRPRAAQPSVAAIGVPRTSRK